MVVESRYIVILMKLWKGLKLVSSLQHWAKNIEMFVIQHINIWPNLILIVVKIQNECLSVTSIV